METTLLPGRALTIPGHNLTPTAARSAAKAWLADHGITPWDVDDILAGCVAVQARYSPDAGFGPDGEPVTVVTLTPALLPPEAADDHP